MSPSKRLTLPATTFEIIEELCQEANISDDPSASSEDGERNEYSPGLLIEDISFQSSKANNASKETSVDAMIKQSGPSGLSLLM